jgi:hydrophobic/amphiphilic exporter-1 (mainly G- bacteria), HAE1 family
VTIGQTGVGMQLTTSFVTMAYAMLVGIGLVYMIMVILFGSLRVPLVILVALPSAIIGAFVALAATGRALDLSAINGLLMLRGIAVTNAIMLLDLVQHRRHSAVGAASAPQGSKERKREEALLERML